MNIKQVSQVLPASTDISAVIEVAGVDVEIFRGNPAQAFFIEGEVFEQWRVWNIEAVGEGKVRIEMTNEPEAK